MTAHPVSRDLTSEPTGVPEPGGVRPATVFGATTASNLVGMGGNLALSVWVLHETDSFALSSALFGCQWLLPLIWPAGIAHFTTGRRPAAVAAGSEWAGAVLSLALLGSVAFRCVPLVLVLVTVRGFCDALTRTAASLVFKLGGAPAEEVERNVSRLEFWRIVGTSAAGVLFSLVGERTATAAFLVAAGAVLAATGGVYARAAALTDRPVAEPPGRTSGMAALRASLRAQPMARMWLWQLGLVAAFQGLHNAIRIAYPQQQLGEGVAGVGVVSAVSTVGVLCGGWLASREQVVRRLKSVPGPLLVAVVGAVASGAVFLPLAVPSYALYFVFMVLFETVFMMFNLRVVTATEQEHASSLLGFRSTLLGGSTLAGLAVTSLLLTWLSAAWSTAAVIMVIAALSWLLARPRTPTETE
ncbi:hypothetical protein ACM01_42580 [Streptomyces viridochromogenes]|uniref:MFS transporter n=1 Tax=Streptomyces viridochromogenes TaxID=1938 RepID=A0A0J8BPH4_STRVR|nr:hypothetical protein [Streptomyces viridochromogenes]KMS67485.1 hypothetical protein ACM01_42580 [Streptomyces viridochromogenes]